MVELKAAMIQREIASTSSEGPLGSQRSSLELEDSKQGELLLFD